MSDKYGDLKEARAIAQSGGCAHGECWDNPIVDSGVLRRLDFPNAWLVRSSNRADWLFVSAWA